MRFIKNGAYVFTAGWTKQR
uniref:Uncharacterized protein n=1 Tax=Anguilla anguilla TaxID=7936 RepID=A0A0E9TC17_ANGAN